MANRVISLIASATEIVHALGHGHELVGRSHECDYPPDVERLPLCSESRVNIHADSREIDRQVRSSVGQALSVYRVFDKELQRLQPTHIITQTQCDVCAVSLKDVEEAVCKLVDSHPQIVTLEPMELEDVWTDIQRVADALGDTTGGERLIASLQERLSEIARSVQPDAPRPTVLGVEWIDPLMSAGNWIPELVEIAGGRPLLAEKGKHSPWIDWDTVREADPEVIAIMPCGFDIPRILRELPPLTERPDWGELRAVRNGRVFVTDGNQYFNRPGPRVVESAQILREILAVPAGAAGREGNGWIQLGRDGAA
jgi:iron complex transport system substrate-binding protein